MQQIDPKIFELISIFSEKLGTSVTELISKCSIWTSIHAITLCLWGMSFIYFGLDAMKRIERFIESKSLERLERDDLILTGIIIKYICIFIGTLIIVVNISNVFIPTPSAIEKLMRMVRGM